MKHVWTSGILNNFHNVLKEGALSLTGFVNLNIQSYYSNMFIPKAFFAAFALLIVCCDGFSLFGSKKSKQQQETQKLKVPPEHLGYERIPNEFIIEFNSSKSDSLNNVGQPSANAKITLAKRASTVGDAPRNDRFRKAVKKIISARVFVDSLILAARKRGIKMKVGTIYESNIFQGAQVSLTENEVSQLVESGDVGVQNVWSVVSCLWVL
jgi:hypothetical protein